MTANRSALAALGLAAAFLSACTTAEQHSKDVQAAQEKGGALTVGKVQSEIAKGMSGAQVAESLGSPNIVTTDELGREVWIYDRFATDVTYSESSGGVWLILAVISGESGSTSRSQRTLTVIVKFDETKHVRDIAYHSSRF
jgi:outer membrane protein assembly factor BamE (lipoprotein component of BamABCDE complex)